MFLRPDAVQADIDKAATRWRRRPWGSIEFSFCSPPAGSANSAVRRPRQWPSASQTRRCRPARSSRTPQSFNDLNRDRPDYSRIDGVVFALNPQVHAADNVSMMQNTKSIPLIVDFARTAVRQCRYRAVAGRSRRRQRAVPAGPRYQGAANQDSRQWTRFAAAWTLAAMANGGMRHDLGDVFELTGARGLVDATTASPWSVCSPTSPRTARARGQRR